MRFGSFRRKRKSFLQCLPGLRDPGWCVISSQKIERLVGAREVTICKIECWIVCHRLIEQTYCLTGVLDHPSIETCLSHRLLAAQITIVGDEISCRRLLNGGFLSWRQFRLQLLRNGLGDLALDGKYVIERPMIIFRPQMRVA